MYSDMQLYRGIHTDYYDRQISAGSFDKYFIDYKSLVNKDVKMLFWDVVGYNGGTPLKLDGDVLMASGVSDKLLSIIPKMWKDENALVKEIEAIKI